MDPSKAKSVLLYILNKIGGKTDLIDVFKVIYFADRKHIAEYGRTILGDTYVAMKNGPVPSRLYDCVKKARGDGYVNSDYDEIVNSISCEKFIISANEKPDLEELSISELECLDDSIDNYSGKGINYLSRVSHDYAYDNANPHNNHIDEIDMAKSELDTLSDDMLNFILELNENKVFSNT